MSLVPRRPWGGDERGDRPDTTLQVRPTAEERQLRLEVQAARWRAIELARDNFGEAARGTVIGIRGDGPWRGLLRLSVPFDALGPHRSREARFLALAAADPVLTRVPLLFVFTPDEA